MDRYDLSICKIDLTKRISLYSCLNDTTINLITISLKMKRIRLLD
jgi:hypothetical protein